MKMSKKQQKSQMCGKMVFGEIKYEFVLIYKINK